MREGAKLATCHQIVTKTGAKQAKISKLQKIEFDRRKSADGLQYIIKGKSQTGSVSRAGLSPVDHFTSVCVL